MTSDDARGERAAMGTGCLCSSHSLGAAGRPHPQGRQLSWFFCDSSPTSPFFFWNLNPQGAACASHFGAKLQPHTPTDGRLCQGAAVFHLKSAHSESSVTFPVAYLRATASDSPFLILGSPSNGVSSREHTSDAQHRVLSGALWEPSTTPSHLAGSAGLTEAPRRLP